VDDLIDGIYRLLLSDVSEPVNIGNPSEISILDFANIINDLTGNQGIVLNPKNRGEGDPQRRRPDIRRAEKELAWEPKISIIDGIRKTIPYFKDQLEMR